MNAKLLLLTTFLFILAPLRGDDHGNYPSLPSKILATYEPSLPNTQNAESMAATAGDFLASLTPDLKEQASLPFDSVEKEIWTNTPPRGPQGGMRLGDLDTNQLEKACDLLAAVLSQQGYFKAKNIPLADDELLDNGRRRPGFGAEDYWIAIFGTPSPTEPWALQFDGHHLAINLAFHGEKISMSPTFIGTQPRGFDLGEELIEPMLSKDETALELVLSLSDEQRAEAIIGTERGNLVAGAGRDGRIPEPVGVSVKTFDESQQKALLALLELYVGDLPPNFAKKRLEELRSEFEEMTFGWWGPAEEDGDFSYRLQGPSLIIEYAGQDLGGDPHDHLHSMYRDPTNEYGARILDPD